MLSLAAISFHCAAEDITNAIHAFLQQRVEVEKRNFAMVIGLVDEHGSRVVGCGKLDNGTEREVDGDTVFEIGSITKTFTALLLQDMVERGEMKLDDPVAKFLPPTVKVPTRKGREITLLHLATHTSGLPLLPENLNPRRADNPYADYTVEKLNAFLAGYMLPTTPGAKYQYSELGMELLGHAIALKAGTNYESLVVDRICRPLQMDGTRVTLSPGLKARTIRGHDQLGHPVPELSFQGLTGGSGLHSTANDLLKYLAANLGLTESPLTPLMHKMHETHFQSEIPHMKLGLAWHMAFFPEGRDLIVHGGATPGCTAWVGFDKKRGRGVVVLSSSDALMETAHVGLYLLMSEWQADQRPHAMEGGPRDYGAYVGQYRLSPNISLGMLTLRQLAFLAPWKIILLSVGGGVAVIFALVRYVPFLRRRRERYVLRWRAARPRKRRIVVATVMLLLLGSLFLWPVVAGRVVCALAHPVVNVREEGGRLFAQATSLEGVASKIRLPHITGEFGPQSGEVFFERLGGMRLNFCRDARGRVTGISAPLFGSELTFAKISDQCPEPPQARVEVKLDPKIYEAYVGEYAFGSDALFPSGINLTIRREGTGLMGSVTSTNESWGAFEIYPVSETNLFFTLTIVGVDLSFVKNAKGEVVSAIRHVDWLPDQTGIRVGTSSKK